MQNHLVCDAKHRNNFLLFSNISRKIYGNIVIVSGKSIVNVVTFLSVCHR